MRKDIVFLPDGTKLEFEAGMVDVSLTTKHKLFPLRSRLLRNGREYYYYHQAGIERKIK